jgi:molybdenum cofactor sulfurtransferase
MLKPTSPVTPSTDAAPPTFIESPRGITSSTIIGKSQGYVVSCTFYDSQGRTLPLSDISRLASASGISLRTGCMCNPGGSVALRGKEVQEKMKELSKFDDQVELKEIYTFIGGLTDAGVVRLSLGLVSNFEDVWRLICWARGLLDETKRARDLDRLSRLQSH